MLHLLALDSMQHRPGPRTLAATATMALLDAHVAQVVAAVERAGLTSRTTFFVVSDHGFKLVKRQIRLNVAFAQAGLITVQDGKVTGYARLGLPQPTASDQMGVLFVTPRDGYSFTGPATGDVVVDAAEGGLGAHGYPATDPELGALFIASGAGIRPGVRIGPIANVDVAPTMAELLGLTLGNVDGKVLREILR
jgi:predicted AlkP superfamily pyrophosphatase or phosphodiesterase